MVATLQGVDPSTGTLRLRLVGWMTFNTDNDFHPDHGEGDRKQEYEEERCHLEEVQDLQVILSDGDENKKVELVDIIVATIA